MGKKRKVILILVFLFIALGSAGLMFFLTAHKKYPSTVACAYGTTCYSEDGMYYVKNNKLYFLDMNSEKEVVVCNRADCKHNSKDCNAYIEGMVNAVMYYDGEIYVSSAVVNITFDEDDGESHYNGAIRLDSIRSDGSKKRNIYTADNGAVMSMKAVDGMIYFTIYVFHGGFQENVYLLDFSLYQYDLRWKKVKRLCTYEADDTQVTSNLKLVPGDSKDIMLSYYVSGKDGKTKTSLLQYEDGKTKTLAEFDTKTGTESISFLVDETNSFLFFNYQEDGKEMKSICKFNSDYTDRKELMQVEDASVYNMNEYFLVVNSDYNKLLYERDTGNMYMANTSFVEEGTYISDIYDIDREHNRIYINLTDYTGILPGTIFYEDTSNQGVAEFDSFLNEFFTDMERVDQSDLDKMDWIEFTE